MPRDWTQAAAYRGFPPYPEHTMKWIAYARAYSMGEVKIALRLGEYPVRV